MCDTVFDAGSVQLASPCAFNLCAHVILLVDSWLLVHSVIAIITALPLSDPNPWESVLPTFASPCSLVPARFLDWLTVPLFLSIAESHLCLGRHSGGDRKFVHPRALHGPSS